MAESSSNNHQHLQTASSRGGVKTAVGEIVEVQGGHIVRSTGRKDRHSKVCTAKGPRDRRVRLAAHTAIQFYDVQDRLGYDRPSKAVDWLIKKAKASIDELAHLPAWHPTNCLAPELQKQLEDEPHNRKREDDMMNGDEIRAEQQQHELHNRGIGGNSNNPQMSSFLPPSMDSDVIADTIKSFFPMGASDENTTSSMQFQNFQTPGNHSQDLRLSLQSFQDPIMLHHQQQQQQQHHSPSHHPSQHGEHGGHSQARVLLSGTPLGFDSGWPEHHQFQRLAAWNIGGDAGSGAGTAGYYFNAPAAPQPLLQQLLGHNQFFQQRGPLQSSNSPSVRAWVDPPSAVAISAVDHGGLPPVYPSGIGFASGYGGFAGFHIPARIQGDEEEHDGYSDKPSSASSDSRH